MLMNGAICHESSLVISIRFMISLKAINSLLTAVEENGPRTGRARLVILDARN